MSSTPKSTYHHGDLKNALIRGGLEILTTEGIAGLSLRKVARVAGVSQAAPYRHFKDKDALLSGIAEQGFLQLAKQLEEVEEQYAEDARALFYQSAKAYIQFASENPDSMRVMFRPRTDAENTDNTGLKEAADDAFSYLIDMVEYCQQAGIAREGHPMPMALSAWSTVHGLSMLLIDGAISPEIFQGSNQETMIQQCLDNVLQGWKLTTGA